MFTWSDVWLLHSVAAAGGDGSGANLADILAIGDMMNHALFTGAELRRGLGKLSAAGFVAQRGTLFFVEAEAAAAWRRARGYRSIEKQRKELEALLKPAQYPAGEPGFEDPAWPYPSMTDARISAAEAEYRKRLSSSRQRKGPRK